jgi:hypothetical protein
LAQLLCGGVIEGAGRFIGEEQPWLVDESADDCDALAFAT